MLVACVIMIFYCRKNESCFDYIGKSLKEKVSTLKYIFNPLYKINLSILKII